MKIVILDAYTVDQGELTWDGLKELAEVEAYERTAPDEVIARCKGAEIVLTNKVVLDATVLNMLPRLQYIGVLATGYNVVDLEVASRQNIVVTNIPAYSTESVAQMVFCHLLNIVSHVDYYAIENRSGKWTNSPDFCYLDHDLFELHGKKMGIIGLGNTGMATARIATGFGMQVLACTSKDEDDLPYGIMKADLDTIFEQCDIISLHCPLTEDTLHLVNAERINTMKSSAILINTGRGPLIDDDAVADALNNDQIAAYGADVLTTEPAPADNPLLTAKNCYLTPHIAWATREARLRLINICTENVRAYLDGEPMNQVN
ncbi:MAG: D-2-hydroxyacid dehydrogenase [Bacteroidaceae bacterium]|nr:D-2-hydroxyacid dehydrogenase [Bacteroidaceae bacterium]